MSEKNISLNEETENDESDSSDDSYSCDYNKDENEHDIIDNKILSLEDDENLLILPPEDYDEEVAGETDFYSKDKDGKTTHSLNSFKLQENAASFINSEHNTDSRKKKKRKRLYTICLSNCKYESVRRVSKRFGFREVGDEDDWNLIWTDFSVTIERVNSMKKYQKINHFPGMLEICRKDSLARNMTRMARLFSKDYNIAPKSWCLPADYADLQAYSRQKKHKTYILKPDAGCQGRGIWITKNAKEIKASENMVCQVYLTRPFLIDGYKFDLRIYVLVTSCDPLRIFAYKDGLVRFTTSKYCEPSFNNVDNIYMHLTNYSLQKHSEKFVRDDEESGTKRRITTLNRWLHDNGYNIEKIWNDVDDVIIKTMISAHTLLKHNYRTCFPNHVKTSACFEILGFDVMFDRKMKPFLIEVNHSPSFHTDSKLDKEIKEALLWDTLQLVNFAAIDKKRIIEEEKKKVRERLFQKQNRKDVKEELDKEMAKYTAIQEKYENDHMGNYRRIYPCPNFEKYDKYFSTSVSLYQETAAFRARSECARLQREEIKQKQDKLDSILKKRDRREPRPESPGERPARKIPVHTQLHKTIRLPGYLRSKVTEKGDKPSFDLLKPQEINDDDEIERLSGLLQRDNLLRALGVVEMIYKALHNTAGTMAYQHSSQVIPGPNVASGVTGGGFNTCKYGLPSDESHMDNLSSLTTKKHFNQSNQNFKNRTTKSSQNKLGHQINDFSNQKSYEKTKTHSLGQRFTPPLNIQNAKSMYRMTSNFVDYQNTNGLLNILKFHNSSTDQHMGDQSSSNIELHGLSMISKTNNIFGRNDRQPISIQQLPYNQMSSSGSNRPGPKKTPQQHQHATSSSTKPQYQSNNSSLLTLKSDPSNKLLTSSAHTHNKPLTSGDIKFKELTLPTVS